MDNNNNVDPNNLSADDFFNNNRLTTPENTNGNELQADLRDQVLQSYLNDDSEPVTTEPLKKDIPENIAAQSLPRTESFWHKKATLIIGVVLAIVAIIILVIVSINYFTSSITAAKNVTGTVAYIEGDVFYKTKTGTWQKADTSTVISEGYSLKVSGDGRTTLDLNDGSILRLNADSALTLTSASPTHTVITNDAGELYSRITTSKRTFDVVANNVIYRSVGTAYRTYNVSGSGTDSEGVTLNGVEVYESSVKVITNGNATGVTVNEGEQYFVTNSVNSALENTVTKLELSGLLEDEFVMWNEAQDKGNTAFKDQMGIFGNIDTPTLNISNPSDGSETTSTSIIVSGTTDTDTAITVNGVKVTNNHGSFSYELTLVPGDNSIEIIAEDTNGNKAVRTLTVTLTDGTSTTPATTGTTSTNKINLSGSATVNGIVLTWTVASNLDVSNGYRVVKDSNQDPVYPGDVYQSISSSTVKTYTWNLTDGETYHFRVCQYDGNGSCLEYSNDIAITAVSNTVTGIVLSPSGSTKVSWVTTGTASYGYKILWSKVSDPILPLRTSDNGQYAGSTSKLSSSLSAFNGSGTYYVRVCALTKDNTCSLYSDTITLALTATATDNTN